MPRVRYVKQRDETSCGPVAIINALKWLGCNISYNDFIGFSRALCKWTDGRTGDGGTFDDDLHRTMRALSIRNKRISNPTMKDIDSHIKKDGAFILGYFRPYTIKLWANKDAAHYTLCIGKDGGNFVFINEAGKTITKIPRRIVKRMIKHRVNKEGSVAWLIRK